MVGLFFAGRNMTLEETVYWIVMIFFALPIALGALLYIWRTFTSMFRDPEHEEGEQLQDEYWKESGKRADD